MRNKKAALSKTFSSPRRNTTRKMAKDGPIRERCCPIGASRDAALEGKRICFHVFGAAAMGT
jgi:hypothetical protein